MERTIDNEGKITYTVLNKRQRKKQPNVFNIEKHYMQNLKDIADSVFTYKNMPKGINKRIFEKVLNLEGKIAVIYDKELGEFLALPFTSQYQFDQYGEPTKIRVTSLGMGDFVYNKLVKKDDFVIVRNTPSETSTFPSIRFFSKKISDIETTVDMKLFHLRKSRLWKATNEETRLALETFLSMQNSGEYDVITLEKFGEVEITEGISKPEEIEVLNAVKNNYLNEVYEFLGIPHMGEQKKERMITGEVEMQQASTSASLETKIQSRLQGLEELAEKWVEFKDVELCINGTPYADYKKRKEMLTDGEVYNTTENDIRGVEQ